MEKTESNDQSSEKVDRRTAAGRRINQLLDERKELRKQAEAQGQRIAELESSLASLQANPALPQNQIVALAAQMAGREMARRDHSEKIRRLEDFRGKVAKKIGGATPHPDARAVGLPPHVVEILVSHDAGPEMAVHFLKNPQEANEILSQPQHLHGALIGQLAERLTAKREPVTSKAPKPVDGVTHDHGRKTAKAPGEMSMAEYREYRQGGGR